MKLWYYCFISFLICCQLAFAYKLYYSKDVVVICHMEEKWPGALKVVDEIKTFIQDKQTYFLISSENSRSLIRNDKFIISPAGIWNGHTDSDEVTFVGGYFKACMPNAILSVVNYNPNVKIILPMKKIYYGDYRTLYDYYMNNWSKDIYGFIDSIKPIVASCGFKHPQIVVIDDTIIIADYK